MSQLEQIADLRRRIDNLLRLGTVTEVRKGQCRVKSGDIQTNWRPFFTRRAGKARTSWRPSVGEQVMLLSLSGDVANAHVLPSLYQDLFDEPDDHPTRDRTVYEDGAVIEYDPEVGALNATGIKTATVAASDLVTINCPEVIFTGNTTTKGNALVEGVLSYKGGLNNNGSTSGASIKGPMSIDGTLTNNGINVTAHTHDETGSVTKEMK
ncbi:MAG: phage baseplate assembly protein V [Candidatus Oceanisphaera merdipullorum]|nr:phage baseplate assembly protein V [Candidatus Oceanisphaera merdipullorum]